MKPPVALLSDDGAPSGEVLAYCDRYDLTLDWVYLGADPKRRARRGKLAAGIQPQTRQAIQDRVLEVQELIGAVTAIWPPCSTNGHDALSILEMAHKRARALNIELDSTNSPEGATA